MRRALAVAALVAAVLSGCSTSDEQTADEPATQTESVESESPAASTSPMESPEPSPSEDEGEVIEIEIEGDRVEPQGMRVKVAAGEPVALKVESDRPAELHVHSSPEQTLPVKPGESTLTVTIDRPGVVDVEEHDTGLIVLQLEVR